MKLVIHLSLSLSLSLSLHPSHLLARYLDYFTFPHLLGFFLPLQAQQQMQQIATKMANSSTPTTGANTMINSEASLDTVNMIIETTKSAIV